MATLRGVTPDLEDVSDSEPEDEDLMPPVEVEHTGSFISCSTPNSSLLSADLEPPAAATMATTPEQSFSSVPGGETSFMAILRETNAIVKRFDSRLDALEQTVAELRQKETTATVTSSGKGKPAVTDEIRRETRRTYKKLQGENSDSDPFLGWSLDSASTLKSDQNQKTLDTLVKEVRVLHSDFSLSAVTDAAKRYYRTCREEESRQRRGKAAQRKEGRRKEERILRKRKDRAAALERCTLPESSKVKWRKVMDNLLMSSEDSGEEDNVKLLTKRPLRCRTPKVDAFFAKLDSLSATEKKGANSRLAFPRTIGTPSDRTFDYSKFPAWAVTQQ